MQQGFTRIQLVPVALPIASLTRVYKEQFLRHHREGRLFYPPESPSDPPQPILPSEFDEQNPFYVWDTWNTADTDDDINKNLKYYPDRFDQSNPGGLTKKELLRQLARTPFSGWTIELLEDTTHIQRQGKGRTKGGRKQLETNLTPIQYKKKLATDPAYNHEDGQIIESYLIHKIHNLHTKNQVTDDYKGHGSVNWLIGNYHPSSGYLPDSYRFADSKICCFSSSNYEMQVQHGVANKYWVASINADPMFFVVSMEIPGEPTAEKIKKREVRENIGFIFGSFAVGEDGELAVMLNGLYYAPGIEDSRQVTRVASKLR